MCARRTVPLPPMIFFAFDGRMIPQQGAAIGHVGIIHLFLSMYYSVVYWKLIIALLFGYSMDTHYNVFLFIGFYHARRLFFPCENGLECSNQLM